MFSCALCLCVSVCVCLHTFACLSKFVAICLYLRAYDCQWLLLKHNKRISEWDSSRQEGPPHSNLTCWSDWPMAVPAVTRQNTSPATELILNLSLTGFFFSFLLLLNTFTLRSPSTLTQSQEQFVLYSSFLYTHKLDLPVPHAHARTCTHATCMCTRKCKQWNLTLPLTLSQLL